MKLQPLELELVFSTDPVVGWRIWRAERAIDRTISALELALELREAEREGVERPAERLFHYRLRSLTQPSFWPPWARMESFCGAEQRLQTHPQSPGPEAQCECGVWAFRSRDLAERTLLDYAQSGRTLAVGRVTLWGRIIEQELGWRAQFGYPVELEVYGASDEIAADLALAYGIDASPRTWPTAGPQANPGSRAA
jgi:hypothetical protein